MKLLITDDDPLVRKSLRLLLGKEADLQVVGTAANGREAYEQCSVHVPDIVLMDIQMPVMDGIAATRLIKQAFPGVLIMMLTTFRDERTIRQALSVGAEGYLLKSDPVGQMAARLRVLMSGASVLAPDVLKLLMQSEPEEMLQEGLTKREAEMMALVASGMSNKEIAEHLFLSVGTVRNVLSILLDKLALRDRTQLAIFYWQHKSGAAQKNADV